MDLFGTDFLTVLIQLGVAVVGSLGSWLLYQFYAFSAERERTNAIFAFTSRLADEAKDYLLDAVSISEGELAPFLDPASEGGAEVTPAERRRWASIIGRKILQEGAGEFWLNRGARVLGIGATSPEMEERTTRAVLRAMDDRQHMNDIVIAHSPA